MRTFSSQAVVAGVVGLSLLATGCGQYQMLQARMAVREGHFNYQTQEWQLAVESYEEVLAECENFENTACSEDPNLTPVYFFLANSYDNLFQPTRRGEPANDELLDRAIENYKIAAEFQSLPQEMRTLAMQYLVAAYGAEKLNDPVQAEPLLLKMIEMNPNEVPNYTLLAQLYEDSGAYDVAEATLMQARERNPGDPAVYTRLAAYYDRQGDFDKLVESLEARIAQEPSNPEAYYTIATYYFNKASRDFTITDAEKQQYAQAGVDAVDSALGINDAYIDAVVYKNLLLRLQANLEKNVNRQQALLEEADALRDRADELRKLKAAGLAG